MICQRHTQEQGIYTFSPCSCNQCMRTSDKREQEYQEFKKRLKEAKAYAGIR